MSENNTVTVGNDPAAAAVKPPKKKRRPLSLEKKQARMGYIFVIPLLFGLCFLFLPNIVNTVIFSLNDTEITPNGYVLHWRGLYYYNKALTENPQFTKLLISSYGEMVAQVPTIVVFSLFFASILNQKFKGRVVARAIFFLPVIISTGVMLSVNSAFNLVDFASGRSSLNDAIDTASASGLDITMLLKELNLGEGITDFIASAANGVYDIVSSSGMQIFILLAAFQEIPNPLYEAAQVEGCSKWETFWKITIPMVSRQIVVVTVYTVIDSFTKNNSALFKYISDNTWSRTQYADGTSMYMIYALSLAVVLGLVAGLTSLISKKLK